MVLDLKSRIREFVKKFADENTFKIELNITGDDTILNPIEDLNLFRIVQQSLTNIQKYARASLVEIKGGFNSASYNLQISDSGVGFNKNEANTGNSYGLNNMKLRAEETRGELEVISSTEGISVVFLKKL